MFARKEAGLNVVGKWGWRRVNAALSAVTHDDFNYHNLVSSHETAHVGRIYQLRDDGAAHDHRHADAAKVLENASSGDIIMPSDDALVKERPTGRVT
ncbi:hypothetical protein BD309DRAFT_986930 [Dichomitus squalens]|nr:hypothetical protein BD309DRAFT_986930 [Dichomitus squalens]